MIITISLSIFVSFLYSLFTKLFRYFSSGLLSSFSVKFRYQLSVYVVSLEIIWVIPEKMFEPLLWFVDPELMFLLFGSLGTFFLSASNATRKASIFDLFAFSFNTEWTTSLKNGWLCCSTFIVQLICDNLVSKGYWLSFNSATITANENRSLEWPILHLLYWSSNSGERYWYSFSQMSIRL